MKLFLSIFLFSSLAFAQTEYRFFSEEETRELNGPQLIGSEYQSDVLAYTQPLKWYAESLRQQQFFNLSTGSLGPTRFLTNNTLMIKRDLYEDLALKLIYIDQANYEYIEKHFLIEFTYRLNQLLSLSLYGEPSTFKSADDAGLGLNIHTSKNHYLRLYAVAVDFSYNERHEGSEKYKKNPYSYGFVGRWLPEGKKDEFLEYSLRWDSRLTRENSTTNQVYEFERLFYEIQGRHSIQPYQFINYQISYRRGWEKDINPLAPLPDQQWDSQFIRSIIQIENPSLILGLKTLYSQWKSNRGIVIHNDLLPHFWYHFGSEWESFWKLGYEFTWHRGQGPDSLRSVLDNNNKLEHRLNAAYHWTINDRAKLITLFTFDLDRFGTGETWEGGNMQFFWTF